MRQALVVDDHPIVREGVRELLQKAFPSILIKPSPGSTDVTEEICTNQWAFVVLDINLPNQNGIDIIKKTRTRCADVPIVVFSLFPEAQYAARALRAGAVAYLPKTSEPEQLVDVVKSALERPAVPPRKPVLPLLSDREIEVLTHFANGLTRTEIARRLDIDGKTVSTYKARLLQKLNLRTLADLIRYATEEGLVE